MCFLHIATGTCAALYRLLRTPNNFPCMAPLTHQADDKCDLQSVEKAILKSDLGMTPNVDGSLIRLNVPQLTQVCPEQLLTQPAPWHVLYWHFVAAAK